MSHDHPVEPPQTCVLCGAQADDPLAVLLWSLEVVGDRARWMCTACTREHAIDIEARLDAEHWLYA